MRGRNQPVRLLKFCRLCSVTLWENSNKTKALELHKESLIYTCWDPFWQPRDDIAVPLHLESKHDSCKNLRTNPEYIFLLRVAKKLLIKRGFICDGRKKGIRHMRTSHSNNV